MPSKDPTSLGSIRSRLETMLLELPGLERRKSRFGDGHSYFAGSREIAHFHGDGRMDIRLTREVIRARKADGGFDGPVRTRGPSAEWASVSLDEAGDLPYVVSLLEEALRANA